MAKPQAKRGAGHDRDVTIDRDPVVSLNGGRHAYIFTNEGETIHLKTDSEEFIEQVQAVRGESVVRAFAERWPDSPWPSVAEKLG